MLLVLSQDAIEIKLLFIFFAFCKEYWSISRDKEKKIM